MSETLKISGTVDTTDKSVPLCLVVLLDKKEVARFPHVEQATEFAFDAVLDEGDHVLEFVMSGKSSEHTKIDESSKIIKDATLVISNLAFDEIKLGPIVGDVAVYEHDFNGTGAVTQSKFYSEMGCNGTVSLNFFTPVYLWLLENM
jgi:hypothetical protein